MTLLCLSVALLLTLLLAFVSCIQLLYLESLRIIRRESASLDFFRETLAPRIGLESEQGSLAFSLLKHVSLPLAGLFFLCTLVHSGLPEWECVLEAILLSIAAMLISTYLIPSFLYRRATGKWLLSWLPVIKLLAFLAKPLVASINVFHSLLDLGKENPAEPQSPDSVENIEALITAGAEEGILEEEDRKLIHSVVAFGDKSVRDVMTPRPNIIAIQAEKPVEDLRQLVIHEQFSRIPVYKDSIDNIIGFVHVRDIFELDEEDRQSKRLEELVRPVQLVPETKPVTDLLREMQREGSHIVIAIDEYGNTAGLATMEDLVEEILGEIRDEHEPDRDVRQEGETVFVAPGNLDLDRLHDLFKFRPAEQTESTTVGGLITELLGHVPAAGEFIETDGVRFEVLAANGRRVDEVRISRAQAAHAMEAR
jgi:putative hemolysin